jgi:hypothetical protein
MRKWLFIGVFVGLGFVSGCATVTRTPQENRANMRAITELELREIGDDVNVIFLTDRAPRLTRWNTR